MKSIHISGQHVYNEQLFPLVINSPNDSLQECCNWAKEIAGELSDAAFNHGAVLIKGLPLTTPGHFDLIIRSFGLPNFSYAESMSNAHRINFTDRVFSANEAPSDITIFLHHEMAQTPMYPSKLFFFCQTTAKAGGATPICRSDILWNRLKDLHPEFAEECVKKGLRYSNVMPEKTDELSGMGRSWKNTLNSNNRNEAETKLNKLGYTWEWKPNGDLKATTPTLPAVRNLEDGRFSFFNQLIAAFKGWKDTRNNLKNAVTFGDGTILDSMKIESASNIADEITFDINWEKGDILLIDNYVSMHGRRTFKGERKVLASLVSSDY